MDSKHRVKHATAKEIMTPPQTTRMDDPRRLASRTGCKSIVRHPIRTVPVLRKRVREWPLNTGLGSSSDANNPPLKRLRPTPVSSPEGLCQECAAINWTIIEQWLNYDGRFTWVGMPVADVGKRYRNVPPSADCPLCRQLGAPWIESFIKKRHPKKPDLGDRIHVFRHLRHLPQVNDFPTSVQAMRKHGAPFHIAVVPILRGWKYELREHFATKGMVVVVPPRQQGSQIFQPTAVSPNFNPEVVRSWMGHCRRHTTLCRVEPPEVKGFKLIDCGSDDFIIKRYSTGDEYVALSYVWGTQPSSVGQASAPKGTKRKQQPVYKVREAMKPTACDVQRTQNLSTGLKRVRGSKSIRGRATSLVDPRSRLPQNLPLTIVDAIRVTRALGFRFLWIDKYCIDQKNEQEKQEQFSRMGDIYAGAQLTLFALGHNAAYGLPGVSSKPRRWQQQSTKVPPYQMLSTMPDPHMCIKKSQWASRGWTYQESLFSTRRLFFTDHQVYFECNAMNMTESFKSNLKVLHTQNGKRFRAYHRAGRFVCGNSNPYSHLQVMKSRANHRKIDIIRRCQFQTRQYTKRELTYKDDVLNAFAGIARYYAKTTARIASLAGVPVPFPLAKLHDMTCEGLDHLSYALAWGHRMGSIKGVERGWEESMASYTPMFRPWDPRHNPKPQRRAGFPSWSWAGWFGEVDRRSDFPHCWTSLLSNVRIKFQDGSSEELKWLLQGGLYRQFMIRRLLTAQELHLEAPVLSPERIKWWEKDPEAPSRRIQCSSLQVSLSVGASWLEELRHKLVSGKLECLILGTHGEPRKDVMRAIRIADRKSPKARLRRIDLLDRVDAEGIVGLIVRKKGDGIWERVGLLKVELGDYDRERGLEAWVSRTKRKFVLV